MTMTGYELRHYPFAVPPELKPGNVHTTYPCVIVGAGLAGLALAVSLGQRGIPVTVIDRDASSGAAGVVSRGVGYASRSLEALDRLGVADEIAAKAVVWNEGRIFEGDDQLSHYVIQPDPDQKWPAFLNIQQFYIEQFLVARAEQLDCVDLRWQSSVTALRQHDGQVTLEIGTPEGAYSLEAAWVAACDGAHSTVEQLLQLSASRSLIDDHWAFADVRVDWGGLQRRFWLNRPDLAGGAAIVHAMADGCIRYDWQVVHLDSDLEITPERVRERVATLLGDGRDFEIVAIGRVRLKRKVLEEFVHGQVIFLGDAAHELPAFGARGGNSAIQDAENLAWKLAAVIQGRVGRGLIRTYGLERQAGAIENAYFACQSEAFVNPHSAAERLFRGAVLALARSHEFARNLINTGRPSTAICYDRSPLALAGDEADFEGGLVPGASPFSAPVDADGKPAGHLLDHVRGNFTALYFADSWPGNLAPETHVRGFPLDHVLVTRSEAAAAPGVRVLRDTSGKLFERYAADGGACYVLRPDSHVIGRTRDMSAAAAVKIVNQMLDAAEAVEGSED